MIDAMKQALEDEINLVLTDPDSSLSAGAQRTLQYVRNQIQAIEQAEKQESSDRRVKVKLGNQFGSYLNGNWFYLHPADEFADDALAKHSGISAPPRREWVGLTSEELAQLTIDNAGYPTRLTAAIEAKLKERNT